MFELTDTQLAKYAGLFLFFAIPSIIAAIADRLLPNISTEALKRALWTAIGGIGFGILILTMTGSTGRASTTGQTLSTIGATLFFASFVAAISIAFMLNIRKARSS